jgi:anti-anti-sigma factor
MKAEKVIVNSSTTPDGILVIALQCLIITNIAGTEVESLVQNSIALQKIPRLVLDIAEVNYLDSYSFGWIMKTYKDVKAKEGTLAIASPNEEVSYLFELTDFAKIVPVYPTRESAQEALRTGNQAQRITFM